MVTTPWILLTYKVPPEPTAKRMALWRRLKGMGAVYLQNGVCLLPKIDDHVRRLKIRENDVAEMNGEAVILKTVALDRSREEKVVACFRADRDDAYEGEIAKETAAEHFTYAELEDEVWCRRHALRLRRVLDGRRAWRGMAGP
jgi:hypothetical protein